MTALMDWLRQARCRLLGGHLPVTKRQDDRVQERCYLCGAALGPGWDFSDCRAPRIGAAAHPPAVSRSDAAAGVVPSRGDSGWRGVRSMPSERRRARRSREEAFRRVV